MDEFSKITYQRRVKPPLNDYKESIEFYKAKLSYKLPVTFRYGALIGACVGTVLALKRGKFLLVPYHLFLWSSTIGFGLCYDELYNLADNYVKMMSKTGN